MLLWGSIVTSGLATQPAAGVKTLCEAPHADHSVDVVLCASALKIWLPPSLPARAFGATVRGLVQQGELASLAQFGVGIAAA